MFDLLFELLVAFLSPPQREDHSIVGESRLDCESRRFGWGLLLIVLGIGLAIYFFKG